MLPLVRRQIGKRGEPQERRPEHPVDPGERLLPRRDGSRRRLGPLQIGIGAARFRTLARGGYHFGILDGRHGGTRFAVRLLARRGPS